MGSKGSVGHPQATDSPHPPAVSTSSASAVAGRGPAEAGCMPGLQSDTTPATPFTPSLCPGPGWGQQEASAPSQVLAPICPLPPLSLPPSARHALCTPAQHQSRCSQCLFTWLSSCHSVSWMPGLVPGSSMCPEPYVGHGKELTELSYMSEQTHRLQRQLKAWTPK